MEKYYTTILSLTIVNNIQLNLALHNTYPKRITDHYNLHKNTYGYHHINKFLLV